MEAKATDPRLWYNAEQTESDANEFKVKVVC